MGRALLIFEAALPILGSMEYVENVHGLLANAVNGNVAVPPGLLRIKT